MKRFVRRTLGVAVLGIGLAAMAWAGGVGLPGVTESTPGEARASEGPQDDDRPRVELTPVTVGEISTYIEATANLVAEHTVSVVAETNGRVVRVGPEPDETVERGAFLVALDSKDAKRQERTAKIKLRSAETLARRSDTLAARDLISAEERDKANDDRDLAQQEVAEARANLARTKIRAPRAGRLTERSVEVGQYVRTGDPLYEITDFETLVADIHIPERDAMLIEVGRKVDVVLQAAPDVTFEGSVQRIASVVDTASGTVEVRIAVADAPPDVRSGSFVTVRLVRRHVESANLLPRDAVVLDARGAHVFVVTDGVARRREVQLGDTERGRVHVLEGVEPGESVVLAGHGALEDGQAVDVDPEQEVG
jgi:membrane fusion protein (multidrug efflux system)